MQSFTKLFVVASLAILTAATPTPEPQLSGLPSLPVCLTGGLLSSLPAGLNLISCAAGQKCSSPAELLDAVPILGPILGGILADLPVGVGLCA